MPPYDSRLKARPTVYKGIEMRSRLEATWAARLDALGLEWEYEPCCFANEHGQYLPDFRVTVAPHVGPDSVRRGTVYFEVKGTIADPLTLMRQVETIWDSEPDVFLAVAQGAPLASVPPPNNPEALVEPQFWRFAGSWFRGVQWTPPGHDIVRREWEVCSDGENPAETCRLEMRHKGWDW